MDKEDKGVRVFLSSTPSACLVEQGDCLCFVGGPALVAHPRAVYLTVQRNELNGKPDRVPGPHLYTLYEDTIRDEINGVTLTYQEFADV